MMTRITLLAVLVTLIGIAVEPAFGQYSPRQPGQQYQQPAGPQRPIYQPPQRPIQRAGQAQGPYRGPVGQPMPPGASAIVPQNTPTLQRRAPQTMNAPFQLTPDEQAKVDAVLRKWEEASKRHERVSFKFDRFEYKPAFTNMQKVPLHIDYGEADFTSSGKWMWKIHGEYVDHKVVEGQRAEQMIFDGNSIYEFNYPGKTVTQHILAKDMKGEEMVKAMLPFLFGTNMQKLKERYFIRLVEFPTLKDVEVCIDAYPRFLDEARNFMNARMIVDMAKMEPTGLMLTLPNGTDSYAYDFKEVKINSKNPLDRLIDPFKVKVPSGWTTHVERMSDAQMSNRPAAGPTR